MAVNTAVKDGYGYIPIFLCLLFATSNAIAQEAPPKKLVVGEKLIYSIRLLGLEVGRGEAEVKEIVTLGGRQAYHIVVQVRSARLIDWIYKVRDTHHSFVDRERLHSLRYEKTLREGRYRADEVMEYDQDQHRAQYYSRLNHSRKEMLIPPDVQDPLSAGFWFRLQEIRPGTEISIPVNADEKNWDMRVKILKKTNLKMKIAGEGLPRPASGEFEAVEVEPEIEFQGIFVKRGKIRGWVNLDEHHVPLKMTVKIPVLGQISARLVNYSRPKELG